MQNEIDIIKTKLIKRIYVLFVEQYNGNNREFARAINCHEKTIRDIFSEKHGMTMNLFLKICIALKLKPSELLKEVEDLNS